MDSESVRSATKSELQTFQVLANTDYADFNKAVPRSSVWKPELPDHWGGAESAADDLEDRRSVISDLKAPSVHSVHSVKSEKSAAKSHVSSESRNTVKTLVSEVKKHQFHEKAQEEARIDVNIEKEALLYELELMEKQGTIKLHRQLTMEDSLESIQYQYDRANMIVSTQQTVDWAKTGIKVGSGLLETVVKKFGLNIVDGFSNNLCKDMTKFNAPLTKMYRKYWRRGSSSPESELAMIVFGALAMTVMANKGLMGLGSKPEPFARPQAPAVPASLSVPVPSAASATAPSASGTSGPSATSALSAPPKLPEWARSALASPLPEAPKHFATETFKSKEYSNELLSVPSIIMPVSQVSPMAKTIQVQSQPAPADNHSASVSGVQSVQSAPELVSTLKSLDEGVRKLTIPTPRTSRKKRDPVSELNFD